MAFLHEFRAIVPAYCKHVEFLFRYHRPDTKTIDKFVMHARVAKLLKSVPKMTDAFKNLIHMQLNNSGINLVIENLPMKGKRVCDDQDENITAKSIHHTMSQFGKVNNAVVFNNHAYVWFDEIEDSIHTHHLINNMKMGDNIISTAVVA